MINELEGAVNDNKERGGVFMTEQTETCTHCGAEVDEHAGGIWGHRVGPGPRFSYLNRCQSPEVPYGHEAHPASVPCPDWCMGHYESQPCTHHQEARS